MIPASSAPAHRMPKLQRAGVEVWAWLDRRWLVMLITLVFAVAFCVVRLQALGGGPASFVVAGDQFVRGPGAPAGLPVSHGPGYDGQFSYRLALRPWTQHRTEFGITFDEPAYRQQRIVYPLVSFVVARGAPAATAWALLGCNIAAAAALGWLGAALARRRSRTPCGGWPWRRTRGSCSSSPVISLTCSRRRCCLPASSPSTASGRSWPRPCSPWPD